MSNPLDDEKNRRAPQQGKAAWVQDPGDPSRLRWWDGSQLTEDVYPVEREPPPPTHVAGDCDGRVAVSLWTADAVVLFDWLQDVDLGSLPTSDRSQRQALMDLLTALEVTIVPPTADEVRAAQSDVAREIGW